MTLYRKSIKKIFSEIKRNFQFSSIQNKERRYYQQTDGQNMYRIDAHWLEEFSPKFEKFILRQENHDSLKRF